MWCTSGTLAVSALSSPANKYTVFGDGLASVERRSRGDHALYDGECAKTSTMPQKIEKVGRQEPKDMVWRSHFCIA